MPSTYTTSLKIQKIGSGEQSGVWGNTTNSNWELIEQAVSGVTTIDMGNADYTLTNLNGVPDEARNMTLVVQGTNSGVRKVIAPLNQPKIYIISNQTTGGYDITIGASTGSFITIPNGVTAQVYTDGTNFFSSQTGSAGDFYVNGNATIEGNLTLNGTFTYTPTGVIHMWSTPTAPTGFLLCNGATVSRATYAALFGVIGVTYGAGDGSTTFTLPDFRNRMPIGAGTTAGLAVTGGSADAIVVAHTHTGTTGGQSVSHTHSGSTGGQSADHSHQQVGQVSGAFAYAGGGGNPGVGTPYSANGTTSGTSNDHSHSFTTGAASVDHSHSFTTASSGASGTNANLPPYLGISFIIKT